MMGLIYSLLIGMTVVIGLSRIGVLGKRSDFFRILVTTDKGYG
jgi:hypothetical protein